ncbi:MAG: hemerythrin domain-containing protein [Planctomycetes bacterium]|nr:hemerythrin domain-containing protein [Planctomycetota bacterium]
MSSHPSTPDLVNLLVDKYHRHLRQSVRELIELAPQWDSFQKQFSGTPMCWCKLLTTWWGEVKQHLEKEEISIFPAFVSGRASHLAPQLRTLELEHNDHRQLMVTLAISVDEGIKLLETLPVSAGTECSSLPQVQRFAELAGEMVEMLNEHINLEDRVLFPLALGLDFSDHQEINPNPNSPE